jgi:hypothetical protein
MRKHICYNNHAYKYAQIEYDNNHIFREGVFLLIKRRKTPKRTASGCRCGTLFLFLSAAAQINNQEVISN